MITGLNQIIFLIFGRRFHEFIGDPYRNIEIVQILVFSFAVDKFHDIRVVDLQYGHVGAPAGAPLFNLLGGGIEYFHEGDRTRGHAAGGAHRAVFGPQARETKAGAAAGLVNQRGIFQGTKDAFHAVFNGQNETGCQLTQSASGIHEGRGVGQKFKLGHDIEKDFLNFFDALFVAAVIFFGFGNMVGHPSEHLLRRFGDFTVAVLFQVSPSQNPSGIVGEMDAIFNENGLVQPDRRKLGKTVFHQFGFDHLLDKGHGDGLKLHSQDFFPHRAADTHGLFRVNGIVPDQDVAKQLIVPHVGAQIKSTVFRN